MPVDDYFDDFAPFYDANYGADETGGNREFYCDLATAADGPVLEVGCGTGRIYLELLRAGVDAHGIDVSSGMLSRLREKAAREGLEPSVRRADVTTFEPEREYALAIVPFRAFLHVIEIDDQLAALERLHAALAPGGKLALDVFAPSFEVICERYGEWEERDIAVDGERYVHRTVTELVDPIEQIARIRSEVVDDAGDVVRESEAPLNLVSRREFELLFRLSPFDEWSVHGGFEGDPLESPDQEMVWIAER